MTDLRDQFSLNLKNNIQIQFSGNNTVETALLHILF